MKFRPNDLDNCRVRCDIISHLACMAESFALFLLRDSITPRSIIHPHSAAPRARRRKEEICVIQAMINQELSLSYPEGFHVMDAEELRKVYLDDNPDRWGIWDLERHIILAVYWHRSNALLSALAGAKDVARSTEKRLRKGLRANGYRFGGFFLEDLMGLEVPGFRYSYRVGDVAQAAETLVLKRKEICYTIYCYAREALAEASRPVFAEVLRSMRLP